MHRRSLVSCGMRGATSAGRATGHAAARLCKAAPRLVSCRDARARKKARRATCQAG
jgi:hypothetical protein